MGVSNPSEHFSFAAVDEFCRSRKYADFISGLVSGGIVPVVVSKNIYHDISLRDFPLSKAQNYLLMDYHLDANENAASWDSFVKYGMIKGIFKKDHFFAFGLGEVLARELASKKSVDDMTGWSRATIALFRRDYLFTYAEESRFRRVVPSLGDYFLSVDLDVLWKFANLEALLEHLLSVSVPRFIEVFSDKRGTDLVNALQSVKAKLNALGVPFCVVFVDIAQMRRSG